MNKTDSLFESNPFDFSPKSQKLFRESFREAALANYKGNLFFQRLWKKLGIDPENLNTEADLRNAPAILVNLFKEHDLKSVPDSELVLTLTSSGTSGQKSRIHLNQRSLDRVKKSAYQIHKYLGMTSSEKINYLCFTYDPRVAKDLGTAFTDELLTSFTQIQDVYYALQWDGSKNDFVLNTEGVLATLDRYEAEGLPVRILGFPAFLYHILRDHPKNYHFGPHSWVQTGGGWKSFAEEEIPKFEFREFVASRLGLPQENIRDMFGMVEHGIPYVDCDQGHLHIPNYARVYIRNPKDLSLCKDGEVGLIHFLCSYLNSYPSISLLTTDWGRVSQCHCKMGGPVLEILGRAGVKKHKGCAITALEKLKPETSK